jgi:hypothetical protein
MIESPIRQQQPIQPHRHRLARPLRQLMPPMLRVAVAPRVEDGIKFSSAARRHLHQTAPPLKGGEGKGQKEMANLVGQKRPRLTPNPPFAGKKDRRVMVTTVKRQRRPLPILNLRGDGRVLKAMAATVERQQHRCL